MNSFLSTCILLFLVIDPLGNLPVFAALLRRYDAKRRRRIILRECLIGMIILIIFSLWGQRILQGLNISGTSLGITGGIMLFLIAIKMLFKEGGVAGESEGHSEIEPFIVPLAMPLFAGPAAIAMIVLRATQFPEHRGEWVLAVVVTCVCASVILLFGDGIMQRIGSKGLNAMERLMGLILTILSVQMILDGVGAFLRSLSAT